MVIEKLKSKLQYTWFQEHGAYVLVDGQFGSTGKGVIAGALAECFHDHCDIVVSNAGPNSGHTSYFGGEKIVLKQLPTFAVIAGLMGTSIDVFLNAGAVIDKHVLHREEGKHGITAIVHPHAAVIDDAMKRNDVSNVVGIASTGQGVGPALERKLRRVPDAVVGPGDGRYVGSFVGLLKYQRAFFEVSQGYSLGINAGFYPNTTTRECTVSQALADAGLPPSYLRQTLMTVRTFPIRVGSTENSSGGCYNDQRELTWDSFPDVEPELTTVTGRVRRIFTWSAQQFRCALEANNPDVLFVNFMNYLKIAGQDVNAFLRNAILAPYERTLHRKPQAVLLGWGPKSEDIEVFDN